MSRIEKQGKINLAAPEDFYKILGRNMKRARYDRFLEIPLKDVAEKCGYRDEYLLRCEAGKTAPDPYAIAQYSVLSGFPIEYFFLKTLKDLPNAYSFNEKWEEIRYAADEEMLLNRINEMAAGMDLYKLQILADIAAVLASHSYDSE